MPRFQGSQHLKHLGQLIDQCLLIYWPCTSHLVYIKFLSFLFTAVSPTESNMYTWYIAAYLRRWDLFSFIIISIQTIVSILLTWTESTFLIVTRVLARISKMPVQNSNLKFFTCPDLATNLLQILIPATFNSLVCPKGQFTLQLCPRRWFVRKIFVYYPPKSQTRKIFIEIFCLSKQEVYRELPVQKTGRTGPD